jgi:hypothetical protein
MADVVLTEAATAALRLAASRRRPDGNLTTCLVLDTVARVDGISPWWRIWLETGEPDALGLADAPDTVDRGVAGRWEGVPLSGDMASAMATLQMLSERYKLVPVSPGVLALALVADPFSGAARELCANGLPHADLLELMQDSLVGTTLQGLHAALAATRGRDETGGAAGPGGTAWEGATGTGGGKGGAGSTQQGGLSAAAVLSAAEALRLAADYAGSRSADELDLLAAMLTAGKSRECLEQRLGIDEDLLQETERPLRAIGLRSVLDVSPAEHGDSALHLLAGLAREPSAGLSWLLRLTGIDKDDIEAEAWDTISTAEGRQRSPSARVITLNVVSFLFTLTEMVLLIIHVVGPGSLWSLVLIPFVWVGVPRWPASVPILIAIPVFVFVTPAAGALQLLTGLADLLHARAERRDTMARTGVIVSPAVARRVALRRTTGGRLDLLLRRELRMRLLRPRLLRAAAAATARQESVSAR